MKILISGGAGFIGSHIADAYINEGHVVHIVDNLSTGKLENINPNAIFHKIDILDNELELLIQNEKFDIISHHAAQIDVRTSVANPKFDAEINIIGSLNMYESARKAGVKKIIFASSGGAIYGEQMYFPADEEHPLNPCSPYGISKLINEKYLYYYKYVYNIDFVALRYSNVYGPRQYSKGEAGVVAIFIDKMLRNEQCIINGDGTNTRDYVYVKDVVNANLTALKYNCSGIFNIGCGIEHDVNYIFQILKKMTSSNCYVVHAEPKEGEQKRSVISFNKIYNEHGWKPAVNLTEGLERTIEYFKNRLV